VEERLSAEPVQFGIDDGTIEPFLSERGLRLIEQLNAQDMERRFLTVADAHWPQSCRRVRSVHAQVGRCGHPVAHRLSGLRPGTPVLACAKTVLIRHRCTNGPVHFQSLDLGSLHTDPEPTADSTLLRWSWESKPSCMWAHDDSVRARDRTTRTQEANGASIDECENNEHGDTTRRV